MTHAFPWLDTLQGAAAVDVAARHGVLSALAAGQKTPDCPVLLRDLLVAAGVVVQGDDALELTPDFAAAWQAESAGIMARAAFIRRAAADVAMGLDDLVFDLPAFMEKSATFRLFRYDKADGTTPAHLAATKPWVAYVEALSRSESSHLTRIIDLRAGDRLLEIGGNTGLMSEALMAANRGVTSRVIDLPAVCALGRERATVPGLDFVPCDARKPDALDRFRGSVDVILFKSVLHDWPAEDAADMVRRAIDILPSGGRVIICERAAFGVSDAANSYPNALTNLVFAPFYRNPEYYRAVMQDAGLSVVQKSVQLDMMFHAISGQRP